MKKVMFMFISLLTVLGVCSCNDNEVIEPVVSDSVSDMEVLSRFVTSHRTGSRGHPSHTTPLGVIVCYNLLQR